MPQSTQIAERVSSLKIVRADDDKRPSRPSCSTAPMPPRRSPSRKSRARERPTLPGTAIVRRFSRTDGRFDLPTVAGRTAKQIARRLA
jgi:hypothetical protein